MATKEMLLPEFDQGQPTKVRCRKPGSAPKRRRPQRSLASLAASAAATSAGPSGSPWRPRWPGPPCPRDVGAQYEHAGEPALGLVDLVRIVVHRDIVLLGPRPGVADPQRPDPLGHARRQLRRQLLAHHLSGGGGVNPAANTRPLPLLQEA